VRGTITSAIWKMIDRPSRTILAPILTNRSRSVVINQWLTTSGSARVRRKLARLHEVAAAPRWPRNVAGQTRPGVTLKGELITTRRRINPGFP
jgi:hypothetical protein